MKPSCTYHCRSCGGHFCSLDAFDLHRAGSHAEGTRYCADPFENPRLEQIYGVCKLGSPGESLSVTLHRVAGKAQRARAHFQKVADGLPERDRQPARVEKAAEAA